MKKIGMVVAMQSEVENFLSQKNLQVERFEKRGFKVMTFSIGQNLAICVQSGVGEIFAASATQMLICEYDVDAVVNFGVCGSLVDGLKVGEVALVKGVAHYDFDTSAIDGCEVGRYLQFPEVTIWASEDLISKVKSVSPDIQTVICASADKFVADEKIKENLAKTFGASVCEMESAGVLLTCLNAGVPCLIVKAVSDGKGGAEEFKRMVNYSSRQYVDLIFNLFQNY
ncbi:MAG: 5'-methylthioadenosine/S-adenosylhomocysteine nucleosidase [Clostridia bacterium]|nr:5'-methylthioadenosine/S-adenosylhomocysteine nucleosidase [Clostridia bacterium]